LELFQNLSASRWCIAAARMSESSSERLWETSV
jgi:hypothetical protein